MWPQSHRSPNFGNFGTPIWESWEKCHLDVGPMVRHKVYYKGESGSFPQVRAMVSLVSSRFFVIRPSIKSVLTMH